MKFLRLGWVLVLPVLILLLGDCKKPPSGIGISFSTDTLTFDTVFSSVGSTTRFFKVYNNERKPVTISDIRLAHLVGNQFRIRVDGLTMSDRATNVEIPGNDSIYVFVEVTVNPNSLATPFVIIDDVVFTMDDKMQTVHLQAWGQNAHFHYGQHIKSGETAIWQSDLPHVVVSKDTVPGVLVDCGGTLKINPGCKVYFAGNSGIFVQGNFEAKASSWSDSITFEGARLENFYDNKPGQWFGIVFLRSNTCVSRGAFERCVINESSYGIYAGAGLDTSEALFTSTANRPVVTINKTVVKNSLYNAVYGFNADITATNSLFYTAGDNLLKFGLGGKYSFDFCTASNTGSPFIDHQKETLLLSNFAAVSPVLAWQVPLSATFTNSAIYGNLESEISFNNYDRGVLSRFDVSFNYTLLKAKSDTVALFATNSANNQFNKEPYFIVKDGLDYTPSTKEDTLGRVSALLDYCPNTPVGDLYDRARGVTQLQNNPSGNKNDIGAIEAQ